MSWHTPERLTAGVLASVCPGKLQPFDAQRRFGSWRSTAIAAGMRKGNHDAIAVCDRRA